MQGLSNPEDGDAVRDRLITEEGLGSPVIAEDLETGELGVEVEGGDVDFFLWIDGRMGAGDAVTAGSDRADGVEDLEGMPWDRCWDFPCWEGDECGGGADPRVHGRKARMDGICLALRGDLMQLAYLGGLKEGLKPEGADLDHWMRTRRCLRCCVVSRDEVRQALEDAGLT